MFNFKKRPKLNFSRRYLDEEYHKNLIIVEDLHKLEGFEKVQNLILAQ